MKAAGILALLAAFNAAAATAQSAQNFLVINNTDLKVTCSTRAPNGTWDNLVRDAPRRELDCCKHKPDHRVPVPASGCAVQLHPEAGGAIQHSEIRRRVHGRRDYQQVVAASGRAFSLSYSAPSVP